MSTAAVVDSGKRRTAWYFVLLALASLIWSGQGIAVKVLDRHLGPIAITFLPFYVTTLLFVPLLLRLRKPGSAAPTAQRLGPFHHRGRRRPDIGATGNDLGDQQIPGIERRDFESSHPRD